jgi:hypothetical protein
MGLNRSLAHALLCSQAYDSFPCQHQLFYRGKGKAFWYEPVFKVGVTRLSGVAPG